MMIWKPGIISTSRNPTGESQFELFPLEFSGRTSMRELREQYTQKNNSIIYYCIIKIAALF